MMNVTEEIPGQLRPAVDAALAWINESRGADFAVTGLVDADASVAASRSTKFELGLVLCAGDVCAREQVVVERLADGFGVSAASSDDPLIPPTLDPPIGTRTGWLDAQLANHTFVLLVFYRGFW